MVGLTDTKEKAVAKFSRECGNSEIEHVADKLRVIEEGKIVCKTNLAQVKAEYKNSLEDYFITITPAVAVENCFVSEECTDTL